MIGKLSTCKNSDGPLPSNLISWLPDPCKLSLILEAVGMCQAWDFYKVQLVENKKCFCKALKGNGRLLSCNLGPGEEIYGWVYKVVLPLFITGTTALRAENLLPVADKILGGNSPI